MNFKKTLAIFMLAISTFVFTGSASAEFLSISAGIPVYHTFDDLKVEWDNADPTTELESDGMPSGVLFHVNIPFFPGLGYESYETKLKQKSGTTLGTDMKLQTTLYDIFYLLPIPIINVTIGGGIGNAKLTTSDKNSSSGTITQYFVQLGLPLLAVIDIHLSYHTINGKVKYDGASKIDIGGNTVALGMAFVF